MFEDFNLQGNEHGLDIYSPQRKTHIHDKENNIKIVHIGQPNCLPIRNVLLIGETGAGKTTILNSLYNQYCSIKFDDGHRMKIEEVDCFQGESQTKAITGYLFFSPSSSRYKFNVMVIDTPGLNDTGGIKTQKKISKQMEVFLKEEKFGIANLHCLAFVIKNDFNRRQEHFKTFIDECMSLFGRNTYAITQILKTHAVDKNKIVEEILDEWGISKEIVFQFDNAVLYKANKSGEDDPEIVMRKIRWDKGMKEWDTFFKILFTMPSVSLRITRETLKEITYLEHAKQNFSEQIETFLNEIAADRENRKMMEDYEKSMEENKAWRGTETIIEKKKIPLHTEKRWYQLFAHYHNCPTCDKTCSSICHMWISCPKVNIRCPVCNCKNKDHSYSDVLIKETPVKREVTDKDMKARFKNAKSNRDAIEKNLDNMAKKEAQLKQRIATLITHISLHLERLNQIARKTTHKTPKEIIDEVINSITQSNTNFKLHLNDDFTAFLQSVLDETDKIKINKDGWTKELKDQMTVGDTGWETSKAMIQRRGKMVIQAIRNKISVG